MTASAGCGAPAAQPRREQSARPDLYACEGCEAVFEGPGPLSGLGWQARIADPSEAGTRMRIIGTVLQSDRRTPAPGVIIYAHHTDATGHYSRGKPDTEWSRRHGLLRGWARSNSDGRYEFETIKPVPYPGRGGPAHVHLTILEPGRRPYWVDDIVFAGEFRVDAAYRQERENRGGSGIVTLASSGGTWIAQRNIILEQHPA